MSLDYHLPDWLEEGTESSLRDSEDDALQVPSAYTQGTAPRAISSSSVSGVVTPITLTPTGEQSPASAPYGGSKSTWQDLDKFYAEEEDEEDEDEDEEDDGQEGEGLDNSTDDTEENEGTDSGDVTADSDESQENNFNLHVQQSE
jgi:AP-3 complex subunit beta